MDMPARPEHTDHAHDAPRPGSATPQAAESLKDPVCGMAVTRQSEHHLEHDGRPYYFCSAKCKSKFAQAPEDYVADDGAAEPPAAAPAPGTIYTCPMHPEIRQDHPGNCPKCGMTLEPVMPTLDDDENPELADFTRRFWWTLPFTVVVDGAGHGRPPAGPGSHGDTQNWIELVLTLPVVLWAGWPFYVRGVQSVVNRSPNMWTLIGLGTSVAFVYSVVATVAPQVFPAAFVVDGRVAVYFEAAAVIISLTLFGQILELKARSQTSAAIKSLLGLAPKTARRINADGSEEDVPLAHVHVGDRLRVRPGREGAGRRRRRRRQQRARRIDAHRRAAAGDQARRRQADRRHDEHQRRAGDALRTRRLGHRAVADRADGGPGPALARADAAHGRRGGGLLRRHGRRRRAADLLRLGPVRPRSRAGSSA